MIEVGNKQSLVETWGCVYVCGKQNYLIYNAYLL